jgi:hypothetical protein
MGQRWAVLIACAACGRIGFDPRSGGSGDGGAGGDSDGQTMADAAVCVNAGPWAMPQLAGINTTFNDWGPALSGDTLRLIFQTNRTGNDELFEATRVSTTASFSNALKIMELDTSGAERGPTVTADGLTIYYNSDFSGTMLVYRAFRPTTGDVFGAAQAVTITGAPPTPLGPALGPTDELFYTDSADSSVHVATGSGTSFTEVRKLTELGNATYPSLSPDGLTIYFTRLTPSPVIYAATRPTIGGTFGTATPVPNIDLGSGTEDPELGKDDHTLVFAAANGANMADLYVTTRTCQ